MGMFNRIYVNCPVCKNPTEFQTKTGSCTLSDWNIDDAPDEEIEGIIGDKERCEICGHVISVQDGREKKRTIPLIIS